MKKYDIFGIGAASVDTKIVVTDHFLTEHGVGKGSMTLVDQEVAADMVAGFGGVMTKLTTTQADYISVPFDGPFKSESYKY